MPVQSASVRNFIGSPVVWWCVSLQPAVGSLFDRHEEGLRAQMDDGARHNSFLRLSDERLEHALNHQFFYGWR
jgi:hypothetical protein